MTITLQQIPEVQTEFYENISITVQHIQNTKY